jgi:IclR family transcriptional regulator, KDG regulon repressor
MTLAEVAELADLNKSTAHRLLSQMEAEGFLQRGDDGRYRIGPTLFQLGLLAAHPLELRMAAYPSMAILAREIGETVNLAILDRTDILILNVIESQYELRMAAKVGTRRPFYTTALGKAIAAFLPEEKLNALIENVPMPLDSRTYRVRGSPIREPLDELQNGCQRQPYG